MSLKREKFCVSDKVDVSGTTFNNVLLIVNFYTLLLNIFMSTGHCHHLLWVNGLVWITYMMYAFVAYRAMIETCFYCKYAMVNEALHFVLLCIVNEGGMPWYLFALMAFVSALVMLTTQAARMDRKYMAK